MTGSAISTGTVRKRSRPAPERLSKIDGNLDALAEYVVKTRESGLRVAHCHGVFDVLHPGVVRTLENLKRGADRLVVTVVDDARFAKGPESPAFNQRLRAESVAALGDVDRVAVSRLESSFAIVDALRPDTFTAACDLRRIERSTPDEGAFRALGVDVLGNTDLAADSPKELNSLFGVFRPEAEEYLQSIRDGYDVSDIVDRLEALRSLRVLVIGDVILDEYHYCKAIGKSSKSATLTARYLSGERHAGGVLAVANHVAGFASNVRMLTFSGTPRSDEAFVIAHLKPNVTPRLVPDSGRTTVVKRRYVDPFQLSKMFEVMWVDEEPPPHETEARLNEELPALVDDCDLVLVCDFGHGTIGRRTIDWLTVNAPYLAVNTQTNSANHGFNLVTKYPRADYICVDEQELRLAHRERSVEIDSLLETTAREAGCRNATVTLGDRGSLTWSADRGSVHAPVLSTNVVDSVGAGDAYLSVTSLCSCVGWEPELLGFIGNSVGALAVHIVGNRESIERDSLVRYVESLL